MTTTHADDDPLLALARLGDRPALEALLRRCQPDLRRYARRHCASEDVDDAVQDALWILARRVSALRAAAALSSWLFMVVRRACLRLMLRRREHEPLADADAVAPAGEHVDALRVDLARAIGMLPVRYREVLVLVDVMGHSGPEVAEQLGLTLEATKSRLHRARAMVRDALGH